MDQLETALLDLYYKADSPGGYGGIDRLMQAAKEVGLQGVTRARVKAFLSRQQAYSLHKPAPKKLVTRRTYVGRIDQQWQADLADMQKLAKHNDGYKYILTCVDVFSKYAWAVPVKSKSATDMLTAMKELLMKRAAPRMCERLQTDKGNEFTNREVQRLLREKGVVHFFTQSDKKASAVERFNRTLKTRLWTYFSAQHKHRYIDVLQAFVDGYNHSYHRSIKMRPADVNKSNETQVWRHLFGNGSVLREGKKEQDAMTPAMVRITKWKGAFDKGYQQNWTDEHFLIDKRVPHGSDRRNSYVYKLRDYAGEPIEGTFYAKEIQPVKRNNYYVESIVRERKSKQHPSEKEFLVKWKGWSPSFNTWLSESEVLASWRNEVNNSTFTLPRLRSR